MIQEETMASAVGAKTARACDICVRRRARWYCAADDAFLCQSCDDSVHSANPLARRHERVRLNTATYCLPTWHRGPTKKPRTPRQRKKRSSVQNNHHHLLVPEVDTSTSMEDDEEEQLLYRVPVYEYDQYTSVAADLGSGISHGFMPPSEFDMAEFAADVEALLGKGLDGEQSCGIEELGLLINPNDSSAIKIEKEEERELAEMEEVIREPFELTFDYDSPVDLKVVVEIKEEKKKDCKMLLRLDYDAISRSWGSQGSPWMNGKRPEFNPNDDDHFWPLTSTMGDCGDEVHENGGSRLMKGEQTMATRDGGREARVSRYREKRRTRLFSKKIRYEVRKLNAEKRPRMKGRFVKRSS